MDDVSDERAEGRRAIWLDIDEWEGPFLVRGTGPGPRDDVDDLGDATDHLRALGVSEDLIRDAQAWLADWVRRLGHRSREEDRPDLAWPRAHFEREQVLLRRLAVEVGPDVHVPAPRSQPAGRVSVHLLYEDPASGHLAGVDREPLHEERVLLLYAVPSDLVERWRRWREDAVAFDRDGADDPVWSARVFDEAHALTQLMTQHLDDVLVTM